MAKFIITGGKKLSGEIAVSGSKNALFPLMAACLLTDEECILANVPEIKDKDVMVELIRGLGAEVEVLDHVLKIRARTLQTHVLHPELVGKLRGSIVLLGGLLGRLKKATMTLPGGDIIGKRPIDAHLAAFEMLGVSCQVGREIELSTAQLTGNKIVLEESSVTATENIILAAVLAEGPTVIKLAATEPHIQQLCEFLNMMGAKISGIGQATIQIDGVKQLHGANIRMIADANEAASFIALAAAAKADIRITKINPDFLEDLLLKLKKMNVNFEVGGDFVHVKPPKNGYAATKIQSGLYPKFASDDMPVMSVLATQAVGETIIHEWMYENRQGYAKELQKMGANIQILDSDRVKIIGPTGLKCAKMTSYDIRMGMTMVIAALIAEGQCEIDGIEHIDRGYERLEERLSKLGADIRRSES